MPETEAKVPERSRWDRDEPLSEPPTSMWLVPANLGADDPNWDTALGSSRPEGFNLETEYVTAASRDAAVRDALEKAADWIDRREAALVADDQARAHHRKIAARLRHVAALIPGDPA